MGKATGILWEGASPLDGKPIAAIATDDSRNRKTGRMVQVWILRQDVAPTEALKSGGDVSICGHCPMRPNKDGKRACYVNVGHAPTAVWRKYSQGGYGVVPFAAFSGVNVRWGAYGDPAMLPSLLVKAVNKWAAGHTGYTHQWRYKWAKWTAGVLMASVETKAQAEAANAKGWGTFGVFERDTRPKGSVWCAADRKGQTCLECGQCDGRQRNIWIAPHGAGKGNLYTLGKAV